MSTRAFGMAAVVPTANRPEMLQRALESICFQTRPPEQVVVVDNGTVRVDVEMLPRDFRVIFAAPRCGASAARNIGVEAVDAEYVAFLDDDDYWRSDYLHEVERAILGSYRVPDLVIARKDIEINGVVSEYKQIRSLDGIYDQLMRGNPGIGGQNVTVRRKYFLQSGGFRTSLESGHDRGLLIDAIDANAEVILAGHAIVVKVIHGEGQITDGKKMLKYRLEFLRVYWPRMTISQIRYNSMLVLQGIRKASKSQVRLLMARIKATVRCLVSSRR